MLIPAGDMAQKIRAAADAKRDPNFLLMARTDAKASEGMDAAIDRARAYVDAGADAIFPEALATIPEYEAFRAAVDVPLLANLTEFGKTPLLTRDRLIELGYNIAIYPVTTLRLAMFGVEEGLDISRPRAASRTPCRGCRRASGSMSWFATRITIGSTRASSISGSEGGTEREDRMAEPEIQKGLAGVTVDTTAISKVMPETNSLTYRGYAVQDLCAHASFEEVAWLMWNGDLPTAAQLDGLKAEEARRREISEDHVAVIRRFPRDAHPMDTLRTAVSYLGTAETAWGGSRKRRTATARSTSSPRSRR